MSPVHCYLQHVSTIVLALLLLVRPSCMRFEYHLSLTLHTIDVIVAYEEQCDEEYFENTQGGRSHFSPPLLHKHFDCREAPVNTTGASSSSCNTVTLLQQ